MNQYLPSASMDVVGDILCMKRQRNRVASGVAVHTRNDPEPVKTLTIMSEWSEEEIAGQVVEFLAAYHDNPLMTVSVVFH